MVYAVGWWNFLKTTNGGENWNAIFAGGPGQGLPALEGLHFINENTGWLVGNVVVMKTTNGGSSFVDSMRIEGDVQDVYFKDARNGIACGLVGDFQKTTNGGQNWFELEIIKNGPLYDFNRISIVNDSLVWLASKSVYKSTDFGQSWDSLGFIPLPNPNTRIHCMKFSNPLIGYAGGQSLELFKTTNGGYNWIPQQTSQYTPGLYLGLYAYNDSIVWASGRRIILKTISGGQVGIKNNSYYINKFKLFQNYPNPFNPKTVISYQLAVSSFIIIRVYDVLGNEVVTLVNEKQSAGSYSIEFSATGGGRNYASGIYFYSLLIDNNLIDTKKMLLIK